jgi:alcohol dehydrogenase class IV
LREREFRWRDAERVILFGAGLVKGSPELIAEHGLDRYELLTTERAMGAAPVALPEDAEIVHYVPPGPVNEVAGKLFDSVRTPTLVALGGGRVIDVAKAIAAVRGGRVAAMPTTLSGAEMTHIHRLPDGHQAPRLLRPALVIADPPLMVTLPEDRLRASAMNALAHGADSLYTPFANPVAALAALRGAKLLATALDAASEERDPVLLALGSVLCAYALDSALFALHHVVCQSLVRALRIPHAETNATMLPRTMAALRSRAPDAIRDLARALGTRIADLEERLTEVGGGPRRLTDYDPDPDGIDPAVKAILARPELRFTPDPPDAAEVRAMIEAAW